MLYLSDASSERRPLIYLAGGVNEPYVLIGSLWDVMQLTKSSRTKLNQ